MRILERPPESTTRTGAARPRKPKMVSRVVRCLRARKGLRAAHQVSGERLQGQSVEMEVVTTEMTALMRLVAVQPWLSPLTTRRRRAAP